MELHPLLQHTSACSTLQVGPLSSNTSNSATLATLDLRVQLSFTSAGSDTGLNPAPMTKKVATSKHPASRMRSTSGLARCPITVCLHHQLLGLALILIGLSISWPAIDVPTYSLHQPFISNLGMRHRFRHSACHNIEIWTILGHIDHACYCAPMSSSVSGWHVSPGVVCQSIQQIRVCNMV